VRAALGYANVVVAWIEDAASVNRSFRMFSSIGDALEGFVLKPVPAALVARFSVSRFS